MKKNVLVIGDNLSKRVTYLKKAGNDLNININCIGWNEIKNYNFSDFDFIKIEPPTYEDANISNLNFLISNYIKDLKYLQNIKNINFLNNPKSIYETLDKIKCKQKLIEKNIPVTNMIAYNIKNYDELINILIEKKQFKVFIKPKYGSGASGVIAYQFNNKSFKEIAYTSIKLNKDNQLFNTKNIYKIDNHNIIREIINKLCKQNIIIETWEPKMKFENTSFDLRVVYQFGKISFIAARGSKSPITNLHLNNCAIPIKKINLDENIISDIDNICKNVISCFENLNICGIDILLTPNKKIKVIEVNGQGDLIYQDIYNKNQIYKTQLKKGCEIYG